MPDDFCQYNQIAGVEIDYESRFEFLINIHIYVLYRNIFEFVLYYY